MNKLLRRNRPVKQLEVIESLGLVVCLYDDCLDFLNLITLEKGTYAAPITRGVTSFCVDQNTTSQRIAINCRRTISMYEFNMKRKFEFIKDVALKETVCFGVRLIGSL